MKKILLSFVALFATTILSAQPQFATLEHNGNLTAYYGFNAFGEAHSAAVHGDIITLSPGVFNIVNISKAITLRGVGYELDSVAGTEATQFIGGVIVLDVPNADTIVFSAEGIDFAHQSINIRQCYSSVFKKCRFTNIGRDGSQTMQNATFINCNINRLEIGNNFRNCQFINTIINEVPELYSSLVNNNSFINSIVKLKYPNFSHTNNMINCVLININGACNRILNDIRVSLVNSVHNCIGVQQHVGCSYQGSFFGVSTETASSHSLYNYINESDVFKPNTTYELIDSIAATHLGTDGTQIGIYGGAYPFSSSVRHPLLGKVSPAQQTRADGKLEVEVELTPAN